ncbi:ATP-dependent sacrificial sulfur transferase LarE, partial [Desulfococcaceae bacterium HSG8]|nr:ATP-dependent sacrificial sulfur transferase LarE [Desulfococcaceae bacterium HSG8]
RDLSLKYQKLHNILRKTGRVIIAFSGGTDSTFLLRVAKEILEIPHILAITAISETTPREEKREAVRFAETISIRHILAETHELDLPEFTKNHPDKCYICKKNRFGAMLKLAREEGFTHLADGENADDSADYRPGTIAARELGVISPLREAGLTKAEIRLLSKELGLPTWNKPAYACLASRIPYYDPITPEKLGQIDKGEEFLKSLGLFPQLRVRHYGDTARLELCTEDIPKVSENKMRNLITDYFRTLEFDFVTLDLDGYRMGSLNKCLESGV